LDVNNQEFLIMDDEYDEYTGHVPSPLGLPITYIWDIRNLEKPKQTGFYQGLRITIDHNQYLHDNYSYQSNYGADISILDIPSIPEDPTGQGVKEVAWFDIYPKNDNKWQGGTTEFVGTWSSYAGFSSGFILINTIKRGAWVVKTQKPLP
jgi:choice-of-anchor B domain-containing protein